MISTKMKVCAFLNCSLYHFWEHAATFGSSFIELMSCIFYYNFYARHTSRKYFRISKLDENFRFGTNLKGAKNWKSTGIISIPFPSLRTSFPIPSGQIPVPVTPIPFSQPKNGPIPAPILPLHDPLYMMKIWFLSWCLWSSKHAIRNATFQMFRISNMS